MYFFFFFQAEDGIRDKLVTGVQTCALPISTLTVAASDVLVSTLASRVQFVFRRQRKDNPTGTKDSRQLQETNLFMEDSLFRLPAATALLKADRWPAPGGKRVARNDSCAQHPGSRAGSQPRAGRRMR